MYIIICLDINDGLNLGYYKDFELNCMMYMNN